MKSDTYVDMRLRCLEMANERAFNVDEVISQAEKFRRFAMGMPQLESNVVDMKGQAQ